MTEACIRWVAAGYGRGQTLQVARGDAAAGLPGPLGNPVRIAPVRVLQRILSDSQRMGLKMHFCRITALMLCSFAV